MRYLLGLSAVLVLVSVAGADTLYPEADSEVRSHSYADTNYGTVTNLYVREQTSSTNNRAVFRFDLSSISGTVTDAELRLYVHAAPSSSTTHRLYFMSDDTWGETTITWNNCPSVSSTSTTWSVTTSDGGTWKEIDVTSLVQQELAGNYRLSVLVEADEAANLLPQYRSRDYSGTGYDPQLVVTLAANTPPMADAGDDDSVIDTDESGAETVTLDGSGSSDSDGSIVSWVWKEGQTQIATGETAQVSLSVGVHTINLTVTDDDSDTDDDTVVITVNPGGATETTLHPVADSEVRSHSYADTNYGTSTHLYVREQTSSTNNRAVFRFDLSTISGTLNEATLRLYVHAAPSSNTTHRLCFMSDDTWGESTITWNNCPSTSSTSTTWSVTTSDAGTWKEIDVTGLVDQELANDDALSVLVKADEAANLLPQYRSRDYSGTDYDPQLVITTGATNDPPVADAGDDQTVTDTDDSGAEMVTLDGSDSSDGDGSIVSWVWKEGQTQIATGETAQVSLSVGEHTITLTVTDDDTATDDDTVVVTVNEDTEHTVEFHVNAEADSEVRSGSYADTNYGTSTSLFVREQSGIGIDNRAVFRFDLSSVAGTITDATLRLYVSAAPSANVTHRLYSLSNDSWGESTITWNNCPSATSTATTWSVATTDGGQWKEIDLTSLVQQEAAGDDELSIQVRADAEQNVSVQYRSRENSNSPELVITAITPNTAPVAAAGDDEQVYDLDDDGSETITLDGFGSSDVDGQIVSWVWTENSQTIATGSNPNPMDMSVGTHTITLTVTDDDDATDEDMLVITVYPKMNVPPVADAGYDWTFADGDGDGYGDVYVLGDKSSDLNDDDLTYEWYEGETYLGSGMRIHADLSVGQHTLTLVCTDEEDETDSDTVVVTVQANQPPVANAGFDRRVIDEDDDDSAMVTLYGTGSHDDGGIVSYTWKEGQTTLATTRVAEVELDQGTHTITLEVAEGAGSRTDTDTVVIYVVPPLVPDYYVDATGGSDSNSGTSLGSAFATIQKAADTVQAGDTVLIKGGVYREHVIVDAAGTAGARITFLGAPGERVLVSGADEITDWTQCTQQGLPNNANYANIYWADYEIARCEGVFIDEIRQTLSRWPNGNKNNYSMTGGDKTHIIDTVNLTQSAGFWEGATLVFWTQDGGGTRHFRQIVDYSPSTHTVTLESDLPKVPEVGLDSYYIENGVNIINEPGDYALDTSTTPDTLYLWPSTEDNPNSRSVEAPARDFNWPLVTWTGDAAFLTFDGLEAGYMSVGGFGTSVDGSHDIEVINCIAHHSMNQGGGGFCLRDKSDNMAVRRCISYHNFYGILAGYDDGLSTYEYASNFVIEENQVFGNQIDGMQIAQWLSNATIRRNAVWDQWEHTHPDGIQLYFDTRHVLMDSNLFLNTGQTTSNQTIYDITMTNNMFLGAHLNSANTSPRFYEHEIPGEPEEPWHYLPPSRGLSASHNTYALVGGASPSLSLDATFYYNVVSLGRDGGGCLSNWDPWVADYNWYWDNNGDHRSFTWPNVYGEPATNYKFSEYQSATGQDAHSVYDEPPFINAPVVYRMGDDAHCPWYHTELNDNTTTKVWPLDMMSGEFEEDDYVELNHDGVLRIVTDVGAATGEDDNWVEFWPPLSVRPASHDYVIANWKDNNDFTLDCRLSGSSWGSDIDIQDYLAGDFDGDQVRDVPDWPILSPTVRASLDYDWVYQNDATISGDGHQCVLTIKVDDPNTNRNYDVTVSVNQSSTGDVELEPTGDPLVWLVKGGERGVDPTGSVTLDIDVVGLDRGGEDDTTVQLTVRLLGDATGDGQVNQSDVDAIDAWAANPPTQGYELRHFDFNVDDDVDSTDQDILDDLVG